MDSSMIKPKPKFGAVLKSKIQASLNQLKSKQDNQISKVKPQRFQRTKHSISQPKLFRRNTDKGHQGVTDSESTQLTTRESSSLMKNVQFSFQNQIFDHNFTRSARSSILKKKSSLRQDSSKSSSINSYQMPIINRKPIIISKGQGVINENKKYFQLLSNLKRTKSLYTDQLFPPGSSTISYSSIFKAQFKNVSWIRVKQLFTISNNLALLIKQERYEQQNIVVPGAFHQFKYMIDCFNSIAGNKKSLEIIFQNQQISSQGIYYLKLFHQGIWQYVVIDDYIPICKKTNRPAFIDVIPSETIQLWPFLLQKAFAKLYNCYEFLIPLQKSPQYLRDFYINFIHQLTGNLPKQISSQEESLNLQLQNAFIDQDSIFLARKGNKWVSFIQSKKKKNTNFVSKNDKVKLLKLESMEENGQQLVKVSWVICPISTFQIQYDTIYICQVGKKFDYSISVPIRQSTNVEYSLRKFKIQKPIECNFSLIQKDKRIFRKFQYQYSWARLIILMKEPSGVRWINGKYGNEKVLQLGNMWLQAGQYLCIVMVDWKTRPYDIYMYFHGSQQPIFQRVDISTTPTLIKDMCTDLAQRFGKNTQLNRCVYSYQYKDQANGFIIQNLHNETHRQVFYYRKYKTPSCQQKIKILSQQLTADNQVEIFFSEYEERTIIIKCQDGIEKEFFQQFLFDANK